MSGITEKTSCNAVDLPKLPFAEYLSSVARNSREDYKSLILKIKSHADISSDVTIYRYRKALSRPEELRRKAIAEVIAVHSGDMTVTGDLLFPVEYYQKNA